MLFQYRLPPLPGLLPFPVFFELRKTPGCFKKAFSVCNTKIVDADVSQEDKSKLDRQLKTLEAAREEDRVSKRFIVLV
nr:hypothetical protein Iba_chr01cCG6070 [Ipomoea batatas]